MLFRCRNCMCMPAAHRVYHFIRLSKGPDTKPTTLSLRQYPLLAPSVCSPQLNGMRMCVCAWKLMECVCVCVWERGWNKSEMFTTLACPHISSFCSMPVHARTFSYYLRTELMGLKVDVAEFKGWLRWGGWEKTITWNGSLSHNLFIPASASYTSAMRSRKLFKLKAPSQSLDTHTR